jgi:hypothetical protein
MLKNRVRKPNARCIYQKSFVFLVNLLPIPASWSEFHGGTRMSLRTLPVILEKLLLGADNGAFADAGFGLEVKGDLVRFGETGLCCLGDGGT